jgi:hypothetical protein
VEIPAKYDADYKVIPIGKEGVLLFNENDSKQEKGMTKWVFTKYDNEFKEVNEKSIDLIDDNIYKTYEISEDNIYMLFSDERKGSYNIIKYDIKNESVTKYDFIIDNKNFSRLDFKVNGDIAYLGGNFALTRSQTCGRTTLCYIGLGIPYLFGIFNYKKIPIIYTYNLKTKSIENNNITLAGNGILLGLQVDDVTDNTDAFIFNNPVKGVNNVIVNEYKGNNLANSFKINPGIDNSIIDGKLLSVDKNEKLIIGTYCSTKNKKSKKNNYVSNLSNGIYISGFKNSNQDYIKFYDFSKFSKFFDYLSERQKAKVLKKAKKAKEKGNTVTYNYRLLIHDIIKKDDEYIMIAEAYYPQYHTECYTTYTANGGSTTHCYQVFDGYRYTHAFIVGFDKDGELLWDNCFEIEDILTFNLKKRVKVLIDGNNINLVYSNGGAIHSKTISGKTVIDNKQSTKIETNYSNDKVKLNLSSDMDFWYDNYFIAYGFERIKNKELKGKDKKRTVFYFNKIIYE